MEMKNARMKNYEIFGHCASDTHRVALIKALAYIDQLGSISGNDISDWDVLKIFENKNSDKGFIVTDKAKINEVFFEELKRRKENLPPITMPRPIRIDLEHIFASVIQIRRKDLDSQLKRLGIEATSHYQNYTNRMLEATRVAEQLQSPPPTPVALVAQIDKIIQDDFWQITNDICSEYLLFTTKPIVLSYVNSAQAADMTVPLGRFAFRIETKNLRCQAWALEDTSHPNIAVGTHHHPHLNGDHLFCFGNMLSDFTAAQAAGDYVKAMGICKTVLTGYWPDNPYKHLHQFRDMVLARVQSEQAKKDQDAILKAEIKRARASTRVDHDPGLRPGTSRGVGDYEVSRLTPEQEAQLERAAARGRAQQMVIHDEITNAPAYDGREFAGEWYETEVSPVAEAIREIQPQAATGQTQSPQAEIPF